MPSSASAYQVRRAVSELGSEAFKYRLGKRDSLPYRFYRQAIKRPFRRCVTDSSGTILTYAKACMGAVPLFHSFGYTGALWYPLTTGMGVVYHNNPLDFKITGEMVERHKATLLMTMPTFLMGQIRKCTPEPFSSLRYVVVGAEKLQERITKAFIRKFNRGPLEGYGCTELSPVVSVNVPDVIDKEIRQMGNKPGTVGRPLTRNNSQDSQSRYV